MPGEVVASARRRLAILIRSAIEWAGTEEFTASTLGAIR